MRPKNNTIIQKYLKRDNKGTYISKSDEHYVRQRSIRDKDEALQRNLKGRKLSPYKEAMALGMLYQGYGKLLFNPNGPETQKLNNAMWNGTDKDFHDAIYNFYKTRNADRANKHKEYWNGKLQSKA